MGGKADPGMELVDRSHRDSEGWAVKGRGTRAAERRRQGRLYIEPKGQ